MACLSWWLSVALYAGLGRAVAGSGSTTSGDVTCTDTTVSTNLLSNPSWEDGTGSWSYVYPVAWTTAQESDGSHSLLLNGIYPFWQVSQTISGLVPGTTYQASIDFLLVISQVAITESCAVYLFHDSLSTANIINRNFAIYNKNSNSQWVTLSGPVTATSESVMFGFYASCTPYRIPQVIAYLDNAKFILETTTQVCTTATPTSTPTSTPPASIPSPQSSSPVSSIVSSSPIGHSSSAASIAYSSPIAHSSSATLAPTSTPLLHSSSSASPSSVPTQIPSASTPVPKPSSVASIIASSSPIGHSSPAAPISPSSPVGHSRSDTLAPTSTPLVRSSSSVSPSSVPSTSTPVDSHTSASSVSSQSIGHGSSSVIPSAPPSVPTGSTSLAATTYTETSTEMQSTSPISSPSGISISSSSTISIVPSSSSTIAPFSTTVISTESNQQPSATGPLEPNSTPSSPIDLPPTTSSGHITTTNVALTTSTIYSTRTSTITACPSSVINCPARSRTTYVTTETIYVSTTVCPVAESEPTAQATSTSVPAQGSPQPSERYTTVTVFNPHTVTATACLSGGKECAASARTTFVTTELAASTTVYVVTEKETSLPTDSPVISVSVSPIFSIRTATITSCPPEVTGCSANPAAPQVVTETLLVGESTYTLSETAAATYTAHPQIGSTPSSRLLSSVPVSYTTQAVSSHAVEHVKTSGSKTTLSVSSTLPSSSTSTGTSNVPAFNGAESLCRPRSLAQIIVSVSVAGIALLWL
ncbi:hypothetical protein N7523_008358 [Penicillium sp. IBT 18751x]|nr:hypothetical protein N7523_008358 [Penicillium sp. IBT 18751x]